VDVLFVLNHVEIKKRVSDVFACVATRATAADMKTVVALKEVQAVVKEAQAVAKEVLVADTTVIVDLALADRIEALQSAVLQVVKDVLAEKEVQQEAQRVVRLEAQADVLVDGNSKKVVLRKRSTNF
jgi:hypothetical protein